MKMVYHVYDMLKDSIEAGFQTETRSESRSESRPESRPESRAFTPSIPPRMLHYMDDEGSASDELYDLPCYTAETSMMNCDSHGLVTIRMTPDEQGRFGFNVKLGEGQFQESNLEAVLAPKRVVCRPTGVWICRGAHKPDPQLPRCLARVFGQTMAKRVNSNRKSGLVAPKAVGGADQNLPILVSRVAPNTPADICIPRLNEGDQVLLINGKDVTKCPHDQVVRTIRNSRDANNGELVITVKPQGKFVDCVKRLL
ncbi:Tyrosine-protein phosphatase non-receptor type 4 [Nymphon striatum]|nr:Tyrosine-protein phosphatase non-receptor type 4 [Nymphon striatum]